MTDIKLLAEARMAKKLITETTPTGIISLVSDSFDFWGFVTKALPELKPYIMDREGTVVIRPDSGDPVDILCGHEYLEASPDDVDFDGVDAYQLTGYHKEDTPELSVIRVGDKYYKPNLDFHVRANGDIDDAYIDSLGKELRECEVKGLIECLWDTFGGTTTEDGMKMLDSHIGAIYGDSITLERQDQIINRLKAKGFVPSVVLGIGSYTYQYVTRDTHGSAVKATDVQMGTGNHMPISKDPKTDSSKKSAKGLLCVTGSNGEYEVEHDVTPEREQEGELVTVFKDGQLLVDVSLQDIRDRVNSTF